MVRKTTIYLPDALKAAVEREAARRGESEAQVIRGALETSLVRPQPVAGLFDAEPLAERAEELLAGFGER